MKRSQILVLPLLLLTAMAPALAQEESTGDWRQVQSPFQEEFAYAVGDDLRPGVEIDGLRWLRLNLATKGDREIQAGEDTPVILTMEFENRAESSREARIILLLEDADGRPLERLTLDDVKVGGGRVEEDRQKLKINGDALLNLSELYIFCEIE